MSAAVDARLLRRLDWPLLLLVAALIGLSLPTIYSARLGVDSAVALGYARRQLFWAIGGLALLVLLNTLDYRSLPELARPLFWLSVLSLALVLLVGREVNGARSWFALGGFRLQPSEFAKVALILALATRFEDEQVDAGEWHHLCGSLGVLAPLLLLTLAQPDLGTSLTFIAVWLAMLWWAGARWWQTAAIIGLGLVAFALMWQCGLLHDYQKSRITVLFDPTVDPRGQGYNLRQAMIAIGSGGLNGAGWLQGTQTHLRFLPEPHTDFIFAVFCEERGFVSGVGLLLLYLALLWRVLLVVVRAETHFGRLLAIGCYAFLALHTVLNIGMVQGVLPITGLPLPFFSYGGSNLLTCLALTGLVLNVGMRRSGLNY